jgi:hypothetical protein
MDNFNFDHLQVNTQKALWVDMPELGPNARVCLRPASEANKPYFNAMLKRSGLRARRIARTDRISVEDAEQNRAEDRDLYPRYVIANWEGVLDVNHKPVPFSQDHARELCAKLPAWLFDRLRNAASTPERFLSDDDLVPDPLELSGNSVPGSDGICDTPETAGQ